MNAENLTEVLEFWCVTSRVGELKELLVGRSIVAIDGKEGSYSCTLT